MSNRVRKYDISLTSNSLPAWTQNIVCYSLWRIRNLNIKLHTERQTAPRGWGANECGSTQNTSITDTPHVIILLDTNRREQVQAYITRPPPHILHLESACLFIWRWSFNLKGWGKEFFGVHSVSTAWRACIPTSHSVGKQLDVYPGHYSKHFIRNRDSHPLYLLLLSYTTVFVSPFHVSFISIFSRDGK